MKAGLVAGVMFVLAVGQSAVADISVGGVVTSDTVWAIADEPYVVGASLAVVNVVTLTIHPGVKIRPMPDIRIEVSQ